MRYYIDIAWNRVYLKVSSFVDDMTMQDSKQGKLPSGLIRSVGMFRRWKQWFVVPFLLSVAFSVLLILFLTRFYESLIFPPAVKAWLESETVRTTRYAIENLRETLNHQEAEISQFKQMHKNELSARLKINLRVIGQLHVDLYETKQAIKAKIGNEESRTKIDPLLAGFQRKKNLLEELRKRYPDSHQKIVALKKEVRHFEKMISEKRDHSSDPIQSEQSLAFLKERELQMTQSLLAYERRIERTPNREAALFALVSQHDNTVITYQSLLNKKTAYVPDASLIGLGGVLLGVLIGILLVVLREKMDRTIRTQDELGQLLSVPMVLSVFDYSKVPQEGTARPSAMRSAASSGSSLYGPKTLFLVKDRR